MNFKRSSGIIMHPTSFPGPDGIGDLGPEAYHWVDMLSQSGCKLWQILPLNPTGYGDSPYQCFSALAGNPYLISPVLLQQDGLLSYLDFQGRPEFPAARVDYAKVIPWKLHLLDLAYDHFIQQAPEGMDKEFTNFKCEQADWLDDFSLFMAIKEANGGVEWKKWPLELRNRKPKEIARFRKIQARPIERHCFRQFLFFKQWHNLKQFANQKGIQIIGDVPIYISEDSTEAWGNPEIFYFDEQGNSTVVAGVPPDSFSSTGQLWGNPIYRWDYQKKTGYSWWINRICHTLKFIDILRLDHFRGFYNYWEIPAGSTDAIQGRWKMGPGADFFQTINAAIKNLPIIAEDLGEFMEPVYQFRDQLGLPGMKVLQFAFDSDAKNVFLPHNYPQNCAVYTGTHDNDTTKGWFENSSEYTRIHCLRYLGQNGAEIHWDLIRSAWSSIATMAIAPMQDFLGLGTEARMNRPSVASGNWTWRMLPQAFTPDLCRRICEINDLYGRIPY